MVTRWNAGTAAVLQRRSTHFCSMHHTCGTWRSNRLAALAVYGWEAGVEGGVHLCPPLPLIPQSNTCWP